MEGDIPSPREGATLTLISPNIAVLIGGQEHTNMDCSDSEVFLKDLNIYEESSCKGIYVIKIDLKNTKCYIWEKHEVIQFEIIMAHLFTYSCIDIMISVIRKLFNRFFLSMLPFYLPVFLIFCQCYC